MSKSTKIQKGVFLKRAQEPVSNVLSRGGNVPAVRRAPDVGNVVSSVAIPMLVGQGEGLRELPVSMSIVHRLYVSDKTQLVTKTRR